MIGELVFNFYFPVDGFTYFYFTHILSILLGHKKFFFVEFNFTFSRDERYVAALSTWSAHTAAWRRPWWMKWPLTKSKKMRPCRKYPECPFIGEMPELKRIDI